MAGSTVVLMRNNHRLWYRSNTDDYLLFGCLSSARVVKCLGSADFGHLDVIIYLQVVSSRLLWRIFIQTQILVNSNERSSQSTSTERG